MGPIDAVGFESLVKNTTVRADTLVWTKSMADWQRWSEVEATTGVCAVSGGRYLTRDLVPYEGKMISADHKDAYFQRVREGVAQPSEMNLAGIGTRFLAKFVDGLIGWVVGAVINLGWSVLFFGRMIFMPNVGDVSDPGAMLGYQGVSFLTGIVFGVLYQWWFLSRGGATPGKMLLGLKVVRSDGSALSGGRAVGRYFAELLSSLILCVGYIMAAFDDEKRALHDRICDTRVIKVK